MVRKQEMHWAIWALLFLFFVLLPDSAAASDWYLRGTFGYEWSRAADFSDTESGSAKPPGPVRLWEGETTGSPWALTEISATSR